MKINSGVIYKNKKSFLFLDKHFECPSCNIKYFNKWVCPCCGKIGRITKPYSYFNYYKEVKNNVSYSTNNYSIF